MASLRSLMVAALAGVACAMPAGQKLTERQLHYQALSKRQNDAAASQGLSDLDILQFALTLENLEETFYRTGFAQFPDTDFAALGLSEQTIADLKNIGATEAQHVGLLQSALAQNGIQPVEACTYDFKFTDAAGMVATAAVLENVGVSAYLGAAPLLSDKAILSTAGAILTVEARHQTAIRVFAQQIAVPQPLDTPLGPRAVFSLAAPFIVECPEGSNLQIAAFPTLAMAEGQDVSAVAIGTAIKLTSEASTGATNCAFTSGSVLPGGTKFSTFTEADGCEVPQNIAGVTYVSLTNSAPIDGVLTDDITVAGPMIITLS
ncbi:ferritin-like domain-containing protein [Dactylonectria estremocensis]|uniref:Ferritin-like domain-containing protein n=1 Tax=Dactylonectria estremocensis TaxID=1079267 RepID=A0A9P9JCM0_9HYPO|nr:ferritin-like domain-containing protein [Dactylonectria estremocensis]